MNNITIEEGNLINIALFGHFDVIGHGCNCMSKMKSGIAADMARIFGCDTYPMEMEGPSISKLGNLDCRTVLVKDERPLVVCNMYTQHRYGKNHPDGDYAPFDYDAARLCFRKMNKLFHAKHIGLPKIGAGLAGGDWERIYKIMEEEFTDVKLTIVEYDGSKTI